VLRNNRNKRYKYGEFIVEGVRNINIAIKNGWCFSSLIYTDEILLSDWAKNIISSVETDINYVLTYALMKELSGKKDTSELIAIVKMRDDRPESLMLSEKPLIVLFDRPSNKGNLGTLIRSCDAFGADCLIITGHAVDLYDSEVITAGMGSFFSLSVIRIAENKTVNEMIGKLKAQHPDLKVIATTSHRKTALYEEALDCPCVVMIGNETEGLSNNYYELADTAVSIPMAEKSSASSFNVACAASVILYEIVRQRRE
ncbi:MAG TPA: TrmH family RNA methyltransferase, partial [Bacillota bacterium]|nr:TrmH family RNA methyltransferase [Bacillota bacterium]